MKSKTNRRKAYVQSAFDAKDQLFAIEAVLRDAGIDMNGKTVLEAVKELVGG